MSKQTLDVRWGILATGGIAQTFAKDLTLDPKTRNVTAVKHTIAAAASSSSRARAEEFLKDVGAPPSAKAYGSYEDLAGDPNLDIIYVATPHSHHYQNTMLCLEAGKNVLCEKAFTVNAAQAKLLVQKAREKVLSGLRRGIYLADVIDQGLFLMEAVWTRYFPLSIYVRDLVTSGRLGKVLRVLADNSVRLDPDTAYSDGKSRMVNMDLSGGALLDLGVYSLAWVFQTLYSTQPENTRKAPTVTSIMNHFKTGADIQTSMLLRFPRDKELGGDAHAIATTSMLISSNPDGKGSVGPAARVQGDQGEVQVWGPIFRPTRTRMVLNDGTVEDKHWPQPGPGAGSGFSNGFAGMINPEGEGHGMFWEADEAATALLEGRKEGKYQSLNESILIMEIMDEARKQGGMTYPDKIESTEYPLQLD
ncbi:MAG: hypothetical protein Q9163_000291 [Psora crenata]